MYKKLIWIGVVLLFTSLAITFFAELYIKNVINQEIQSFQTERCLSCDFKYRGLSVSLLPPAITFNGVALKQGTPIITEIKALIPKLRITLNPLPLLKKQIHITRVVVESPSMAVQDGDEYSPKTSEKPSEPMTWQFAIYQTEIKNGTFEYIRYSPKHEHRGFVSVKDINGTIGAMGTTHDLVEVATAAQAYGTLENSGRVDLKIQSPVFSKNFQAQVDWATENLNLRGLNTYFDAFEGAELKGEIVKARSSVELHEQTLKAWVQAEYRDLDITFKQTPTQNALIAFVQNLVGAFKIRPTAVAKPVEDITRGIERKRGERETLISFMFQGMKEAALRVVTEN